MFVVSVYCRLVCLFQTYDFAVAVKVLSCTSTGGKKTPRKSLQTDVFLWAESNILQGSYFKARQWSKRIKQQSRRRTAPYQLDKSDENRSLNRRVLSNHLAEKERKKFHTWGRSRRLRQESGYPLRRSRSLPSNWQRGSRWNSYRGDLLTVK